MDLLSIEVTSQAIPQAIMSKVRFYFSSCFTLYWAVMKQNDG